MRKKTNIILTPVEQNEYNELWDSIIAITRKYTNNPQNILIKETQLQRIYKKIQQLKQNNTGKLLANDKNKILVKIAENYTKQDLPKEILDVADKIIIALLETSEVINCRDSNIWNKILSCLGKDNQRPQLFKRTLDALGNTHDLQIELDEISSLNSKDILNILFNDYNHIIKNSKSVSNSFFDLLISKDEVENLDTHIFRVGDSLHDISARLLENMPAITQSVKTNIYRAIAFYFACNKNQENAVFGSDM